MDKPRKVRITDAGNTYRYAANIIRRKGYKIFYVPNLDNEYEGTYWAIKDERDFISDDILHVLALINIWEEFGDEWYTKPKYPLEKYDTIYYYSIFEFETVEDLQRLSQEEFEDIVQSFQILFEALSIDLNIPLNIPPEEMFELMKDYNKIDFETVSLKMDWEELNTAERIPYFRKFIEKIFHISDKIFQPQILYFDHDYAAIDDEYHVWWMDITIEWKGKKYDFRLSYDYAYFKQMKIPELIEDLNKILMGSNYEYIYLKAGNEYLISFTETPDFS